MHGSTGRSGEPHQGRRRPPVPLADLDPALTAISHKVIGCAMEVHMELGPGYDEDVYMNALKDELEHEGIRFKADHAFDVSYQDKVVGKAVADLFIEDRFVVEVMARPIEIGSYERAVLCAQLRAGDLELGLIINFAGRRLKDGLVRVLNPDKLNAGRGEAEEESEAEDHGEP